MKVIKRSGKAEEVSFDKVITRIRLLCDIQPVITTIDPIQIAQKVCAHIYDGVNTTELDELAAEMCFQRSVDHPDYGTLASRIIISNNQKMTSPSFSETVFQLYHNTDSHGKHCPLVSLSLYETVMEHKHKLNQSIDSSRDFLYDYFAFKTLEKGYLLKVNGKTVERIQHLWMRVSLGIHGNEIKKVVETYDLMSQKYFTHATPTLFHSGTPHPQLLSCFLVGVHDSVEGIYKAITDAALISKWAGGIGFHIHDIRSDHSIIRSTNGKSGGIVPMLRVFNDVARHINQSGKRNGSFAMYLEPHHPDILAFLDCKKNHGDENARARDLFYAVWVSDLFMERVRKSEMWSLFCPDRCPKLSNAYGDEYTRLYIEYEQNPANIVKQLPAQDVWKEIVKSQMETGTPYLTFKDAANSKSNQKHYGTIKSSNLCVASKTRVLTDQGYIEIQTLKDQWVNVWNGSEFSRVQVKQTGQKQSLVCVQTTDGAKLKCTPYHTFYINDPNVADSVYQCEAKDLKPGMNLLTVDSWPCINGKHTFTESWLPSLLWSSVKTKVEWVSGIFDKHGIKDKRLFHVFLETEDEAIFIKLVLQTLGINPVINQKEVTIIPDQIQTLCNLGLDPERWESLLPFTKKQKDESDLIHVQQVEELTETDDTYCFTEPLKHTAVFDGMLTGQCSEIIEYSDEKEYACCTLASISLPAFVEEFDFSSIQSITVYSKSKCQACQWTKNLLTSYHLTYKEVSVETEEGQEKFDELTVSCDGDKCTVGNRSLPQVEINGQLVCGFAEVYKYFRPRFNFSKLMDVVKVVTSNLDKIIDLNHYPVPETKVSNKRHRPLGIGAQGLADVYAKFKVAFDSEEAKALNRSIFACMYYAACEKSHELSVEHQERMRTDPSNSLIWSEEWNVPEQWKGSYSTFEGSPMSQGQFQFDLWNAEPVRQVTDQLVLDWDQLKQKIQEKGLRNSLLMAPMPTASTSQILGNNECIEPFTSNIYSRGTLAGQFIVVNKYLLDDLIRIGVWSPELKDDILLHNGSIQSLTNIPLILRQTYKIAWDMSMKDLIDQAADRGIYVCQSQSLNLWIEDPDISKLTAMLFYAWRKGLKTGMYYLRRRAVSKAQSFSIDAAKSRQQPTIKKEEECLMCSA